ncbi:sigma-70 family RNA polymerase sigma factor [Bremerella cremea]|uniref:RNA polymerase sigma factor n=1 Tax=Bremerella cremea TaxID=1031537 RepID=UPI0031F03777
MNDPPPSITAENSIVTQHAQAVWGVIVRILGNDGHDAADCLQQTFLEFVEHERKKSVRSALALLKRIATSRAIDLVRRRIRERNRIELADPDEVIATKSLLPGRQLEAEELREALREAITKLTDDQASAFVLTAIEELSHQEAAEVMETSANHLGVLLHRARIVLREQLSEYAPQKRSVS